MAEKYNWLFGENTGKTADNNSYYLWRHIVSRHFDDVNAVFIAERNKQTRARYRSLSAKEKSCFIWRNSLEHIRLYDNADLLFVSLSFRDVQPDRIAVKSYQPLPSAPLVYLQHGTLAIKSLGYKNYYANNCMFRFVYYNPRIPEKLERMNEFKSYQLFDGKYLPRYCELARRALERKPDDQKRILWFITWREYFGDNNETEIFLRKIKTVLKNKRFSEYCRRKNCSVTVCLHRGFTEEQVAAVRDAVGGINVRLVYAQDENVMNLLVEHDVLITDYSSVGFDFTFLGKPTILFQPDVEAYLAHRELYCTLEEMRSCNIEKTTELIDTLVSESYDVNPFFAINVPEKAELPEIADGKYNERFFQYFYQLQKNSIAFLGYDFSGIGGSVFATRALMEGLLEAGYLVRAYTLKQMMSFTTPAGLALKPATRQYRKKISDKLAQKLVFSPKHYSYLNADPAKNAMRPLAGAAMTHWMEHIHAHTVVSTRESLHLFLRYASSPMISKRIYFFHTSSELVESLFPGVLAKLQKDGIENAVFVTDNTRKNLAVGNGFDHYERYCVIGNCLDSSRSIAYEELESLGAYAGNVRRAGNEDESQAIESGLIHCIYITRISSERAEAFGNMLQFARFLKASAVRDVVIDLYGEGDYLKTLFDQIDEEELNDYIEYHGKTVNIKQTMQSGDLLVDFSNIQSFGMTYIEGVLNGRMVLCRHSEGADEVLAGIPEAFYDSDEELLEKIYASRSLTLDSLKKNYRLISQKYSRSIVTARFIQGNDLNMI